MADFTTTLAGAAAVFGQQAKLVEDACAQVMKDIVFLTAEGVITATPVDTGLARSNWQASLHQEKSGVVPPHYPYPKFSQANGQGVLEQANASAALGEALTAVENYKPDDTAFLVNNVDYIGDLNEGINRDSRFRPSTQAPVAFVETSVMRAIDRAVRGFTI